MFLLFLEGRRGGEWNYARTAALVNRALENNIEGVKRVPNKVDLEKNVVLNGVIENAPHMAKATNYMRSQAVDYNENFSLNGPFDLQKVKKPVDQACKMDWFVLPKSIKLDFGKAEKAPGLNVILGDPVLCGCSPDTIKVSFSLKLSSVYLFSFIF